MDKREVASLVGELKGAPASVVLALVLLQRPVTVQELSVITRYSEPTLRRGLDRLALTGFIQEESKLGQYQLTVLGRQFILGEVGNVLTVDEGSPEKEKNFFRLHDSKIDSPISSSEEKNISLSISPVPEKEKNIFDENAEDTVRWLMKLGRWERTNTGKGARDSVEAALAAGWSGADCYNCVLHWSRFARTEAGKWIKDLGGWIAKAMREQMPNPNYELDRDDPEYWDWVREDPENRDYRVKYGILH